MLAQVQPGARATDHERRLGHVLATAHQRDAALAEQQRLRGGDDGLQTGAAEPVDCERRRLDGRADLEADVAREVDGVLAGLQDVAKDDLVHVLGVYAGALECGFGGDGAEVNR